MAQRFFELAFTPGVRAAQRHYYGREGSGPPTASGDDRLGPKEASFIGTRDSFYLASVSETGWPYVQHRGGPRGFLKVLSPSELAFADTKGNRQMLTTGNLAASDRVSLFLMDYPARERLKLLGHASVIDAREHLDLAAAVAPAELASATERIFLIRVVAYDWNCPKYITPRYTAAEVDEVIAPLRARIEELEAALAAREKCGDANEANDSPSLEPTKNQQTKPKP